MRKTKPSKRRPPPKKTVIKRKYRMPLMKQMVMLLKLNRLRRKPTSLRLKTQLWRTVMLRVMKHLRKTRLRTVSPKRLMRMLPMMR